MEIRRLRPGDGREAAALVAESFADEMALRGVSTGSVRDQMQGAVIAAHPPISWLTRASGAVFEFWVAEGGGRLVGCYVLYGRSPLTISTVAVRQGRRGEGIGRALMEHCLARARQLGRREVVLEVLADNDPAVRLYRSLGLREYDRRRTYTRRLPLALPAPSPRLELLPVDRERARAWYAVAGASLPAEALRFEHTYRSEYIGTPMRRRLGELGATGRTARRAALADGKVVGYTCIRALPRQPSVEILAPLYLPGAAPYLPALIARAAREAAGSGHPLCRLHLADSRPEGWAVAEALGFRLERTWAYMYGEV